MNAIYRNRTLALMLSWLPILVLNAQDSPLGSWNILNAKLNINAEWSCFGELQLRSLRFYDHFHYHEAKGGINYKPSDQLMFTIGGGQYDTYKEGGTFVRPKNNSELRLWPQITLNQTLGPVNIEQRYRAEFRFTSNGYRNRFRYRLGVVKSMPGKFKSLKFGLFNELFFSDKEPYFERNRASIVATYKLNKNLAFQVGYLYQFDYKINDETGKDFLQVGVLLEWSRPKSSNAEVSPVD